MGSIDETKGKLKQAVADVTENEDLEREGEAQSRRTAPSVRLMRPRRRPGAMRPRPLSAAGRRERPRSRSSDGRRLHPSLRPMTAMAPIICWPGGAETRKGGRHGLGSGATGAGNKAGGARRRSRHCPKRPSCGGRWRLALRGVRRHLPGGTVDVVAAWRVAPGTAWEGWPPRSPSSRC